MQPRERGTGHRERRSVPAARGRADPARHESRCWRRGLTCSEGRALPSLFAKLFEFFDDLIFFDAGAGEQTFKSGGRGAQGMKIGFQNWFTFGGNVKADGLAMPGYGDGILALQQRRHALTKFPYSYFGRGHNMCSRVLCVLHVYTL
jgi:hypothetical protein